MEGCPTALLVDLADPIVKVGTPRTPRHKTPRRTLKTPKTPLETRKRNNSKHNDVKKNILSSLENGSTPLTRRLTCKEPRETSRKDVLSTPEMPENYCLLDEEKFDFDLSLSPESNSQSEDHPDTLPVRRDDEEEIFFGPVGYKEKCIAKAVDTEAVEQPDEIDPLSASEMVLLFKEAHTVAFHVKARGTPMKTSSQSSQSSQSDFDSPVVSEAFSSQGTKRKLNIDDTDVDLPSSKVQVTENKKVAETTVLEGAKPRKILPRLQPRSCDNKTEAIEVKSKLQRASSMRLPKSRLSGCSASVQSEAPSRLQCPGTRTRHLSMNNKSSGDGSQSLNSSLCVPGQKVLPKLPGRGLVQPSGLAKPLTHSGDDAKKGSETTKPSTGLTRKPSLLRGAMTRPELMKPGGMQRKSLAANTGKVPISGMPRGPMKATAPMKSVPNTPMSTPAMTKPLTRNVTSRGTSSPRLSSSTATPVATPGSGQPKGRLSMTTPQSCQTRGTRHSSTPPNPPPSSSKAATPRQSLSGLSALPKRHSHIPSPAKNISFSSARSMRSSTSSTDSVLESPPLSNTSLNQSRNSSSRPRRSLMTPTTQSSDNIRRAIPSPSTRRSIASPGTRLASKLKPLRLVDAVHKHNVK